MMDQVTLECPFCGEQTISAIYIPPTYQERKGPWGGSKPQIIRSGDKHEITSGCSKCKKTMKQVKKRMKRGKTKDDKIIERLRKAGMPLEFTTKFE